MENKRIIAAIIVLLVICGIFVGIITIVSSKNTTNILSKGDIHEVVAKVNGEEITRFDINYISYINDSVNKSQKANYPTEFEDIKKEAIKDKVLFQEALKNNMGMTDEDKKAIKDLYASSVTDADKRTAKKLEMSDEEYLDYVVNKQAENETTMKYKTNINDKISKGEISIEDEEFKKAYEAYQNYSSEDVNEQTNTKMELLDVAYNAYVDYLVRNSEIS